jgi:hypothetical protein
VEGDPAIVGVGGVARQACDVDRRAIEPFEQGRIERPPLCQPRELPEAEASKKGGAAERDNEGEKTAVHRLRSVNIDDWTADL